MAYSETEDLLIGDLPLSGVVDPEKYIQDATDEIDSYIGNVYTTPLDVSDTSSIARHSRLLIKRICNHLSTGRLILAVASPSEDTQLHAYGASLVQNALEALVLIAEGKVLLEGAPSSDTNETVRVTTPLIYNKDTESQVEAFYDRIANPSYKYPFIEGWTQGQTGFVAE